VLSELGDMASQETSKDLLVRTSSFDGVTGTFSVPARTAAVRLALNPHPRTRLSCRIECYDGDAPSVRAHPGVYQAAIGGNLLTSFHLAARHHCVTRVRTYGPSDVRRLVYFRTPAASSALVFAPSLEGDAAGRPVKGIAMVLPECAAVICSSMKVTYDANQYLCE
jgi:hypothetical protein